MRQTCVAILVGFTLSASCDVSAAERPNIIFVMADDLGFGDLGCFGQAQTQTPHIDRIADQGTKFTQCYSGSTVCAPSRCSLLTGKHMGHARIRGNGGWIGPADERRRASELPLHDEDVTIAEVLQSVGYTTGAAGKWGVGQPGSTGVPWKQGFDEFVGFLNQRHAHGYYPEYIWENDVMVSLDGNLGGNTKDWIHDRFTSFALSFIEKNADGPFFLYLPYTIPHGRYEVPDDKPYSDEPWPESIRNYAAMVTRMDRDVGRIDALLKQLDLFDNTLVFFTSDNGAEIYYYRKLDLIDEYDETLESRGGLNGWKRDLTDGGIRVPMIARWPSKISAGQTSDFVWALYDMLPTLAEVAAADTPSDIDGQSVMPALLGEQQTPHEYLYWEFFERGFQQALRFGPYKAIRFKQGKPLVLFHLPSDPGEQTDVAAQHPEVVDQAERYLLDARTESPNWPK